MKKKSTIALILSLGIVGSASAATGGTTIGTGSSAISQSLTASSCSVSFPSDVTLPSFSTADFNATSASGSIGDEVSVGNIVFSGCNGNTVNVAVTSGSKTSNSGYIYPQFNGADQGYVGYWLKINSNGAKPNSTVSSLQNMSINSDSYSLPVTIATIKMKSGSFSSTETGNYTANVTYTATYS